MLNDKQKGLRIMNKLDLEYYDYAYGKGLLSRIEYLLILMIAYAESLG